MMFKILLVCLLVLTQLHQFEAKKRRPETSIESAANTISEYLHHVSDFLEDVVSMFDDYMYSGSPNKKKKTSSWDLDGMWRYAKNNLQKGFEVVEETVSMLRMARSTIDDVSPILPDVTMTQFVEALLINVVPELMKKPGEESGKSFGGIANKN